MAVNLKRKATLGSKEKFMNAFDSLRTKINLVAESQNAEEIKTVWAQIKPEYDAFLLEHGETLSFYTGYESTLIEAYNKAKDKLDWAQSQAPASETEVVVTESKKLPLGLIAAGVGVAALVFLT
jgi:hypothetical protein